MSASCDQIADELLADLRGELSDSETTGVENHLATCDRCRAEREEMALLDEIVRSHPGPAPAPDGFARIRDRIQLQEEAARRRRRLLFLALPLAAAAALLVTFLLPSSSPLTLTAVRGEVHVSGKRTAVGEGRPIRVGDVLTATAPCHLEIANGRKIDLVLDGGSSLTIEAPALYRLDAGRILVSVRPGVGEVAFATPAGRAVVTGTQFNLIARTGRTELAVLEGEVEFRTGADAPVRVVSGHSVSIPTGGSPGAVRKVDPWQVRDWCCRPTARLLASPSRLVVTIENSTPLPLVLKPFDPGSAAYSLRIEAADARIPPREVRIQSAMVIHDNRTPEGPDVISLAPGDVYRLAVDPARLDLPRGRYRISAVYKPYKDLPETAWRGPPPLTSPPAVFEVD